MPGKITELTDAGTLTGDELVEVVGDPSGTPVSRKATVTEIAALGQILPPVGAGFIYPYGVGYSASTLSSNVSNSFGSQRWWPFYVAAEVQVDQASIYVTTGIDLVGAVIRLGVYASDATGQASALAADFGTVEIEASGVKTTTPAAFTLQPGVHWMVAAPQGPDNWAGGTVNPVFTCFSASSASPYMGGTITAGNGQYGAMFYSSSAAMKSGTFPATAPPVTVTTSNGSGGRPIIVIRRSA